MPEEEEWLLMNAPCGIFSFTEDGAITMANAYCCRLLEYEQEELTGLNISDLLTLPGRIFHQTHFYPLVKLHQHAEEIFLNFQSKFRIDVPVVLNAVVSQGGDQPVIVCSFIQVLNRRKYEDEILLARKKAEEALMKNEALEKVRHELEAQQKELDKQITLLKFQNNELVQLGNVITHDLQEPVRKLILFSNELLQRTLPESKKDYALSVINRSSQKVKKLLLNLQEYLSLTSPAATKTQVSLDGLIQGELKQLQKNYPDINVQSTVAPLPIISAYENQLQFMFHHILKNAFDHGTNHNNLVLAINAVIVKENLFNYLSDKYTYIDFVRITISDNGPGFEGRYKDYIFDFLKKLDPSTDSSGFGLAFCKKIAENHFGHIKADSSVGNGTTFTIMLPVN